MIDDAHNHLDPVADCVHMDTALLGHSGEHPAACPDLLGRAVACRGLYRDLRVSRTRLSLWLCLAICMTVGRRAWRGGEQVSKNQLRRQKKSAQMDCIAAYTHLLATELESAAESSNLGLLLCPCP